VRGNGKSGEREIERATRRAYLFIMKINEFARPFPLRTLMVCFTIWLIATEVLIFNQVKFDAKTELLQEAARSLRGPEVIVPNERPAHAPGNARMQKL
jgi:hypothetical protein